MLDQGSRDRQSIDRGLFVMLESDRGVDAAGPSLALQVSAIAVHEALPFVITDRHSTLPAIGWGRAFGIPRSLRVVGFVHRGEDVVAGPPSGPTVSRGPVEGTGGDAADAADSG